MEKENKLSYGMKHLLIMIGIAVLLMFAGILKVEAAESDLYIIHQYDSYIKSDECSNKYDLPVGTHYETKTTHVVIDTENYEPSNFCLVLTSSTMGNKPSARRLIIYRYDLNGGLVKKETGQLFKYRKEQTVYHYKEDGDTCSEKYDTTDFIEIYGLSGIHKPTEGTTGTEWIVNLDTNLPIFASVEDAKAYYVDGDDTGMINPSYNESFELKSFDAEFKDKDLYTGDLTCTWNGTTLDESILYESSGFNIEAWAEKDNNFAWVQYILQDEITINTNEMQLNMFIIHNRCMESGYVFYDEDVFFKERKIRITPYYILNQKYIYGKSILIELTDDGQVKNILQSTGNVYDDNLPPEYEDILPDWEDTFDDLIYDENGDISMGKLTSNFFTVLFDLLEACGEFPDLCAKVFSFLPEIFLILICGGLSVIVILRLLGR